MAKANIEIPSVRQLVKLYGYDERDLYKNVDVGVRPFIRTLNEVLGIESHSSCSGHAGQEGDVFDGYGPGVRTKRGPTIKLGNKPHVNFTGDRIRCVDYLDFLGYRLSENRYDRKLFQFAFDRDNWSIQVDPTSSYSPISIGYLELMAHWEMLRQFTTEYLNGAGNKPRPRISQVDNENENWTTIDDLIKNLQQVEELKKPERMSE